MRLEVTYKKKLKRSPTSICSAFGRLFAATKGKRVFYVMEDGNTLKSIVFSHQVNTLCATEHILFCAQQNGDIFGLNSKHKVVLRASIGDTSAISSLFEQDLFVASEKKVAVLGTNSLLKNSFFFAGTSLIQIDLSKSGMLAAALQNDQHIQLLDTVSKEKSTFKISDGYPETVRFLNNDLVAVGTSKGTLGLFSVTTRKRISFLKFSHTISSLWAADETSMLVGTADCRISLVGLSEFNKLVLLDQIPTGGIPVEFCRHEDRIGCAVSRECRLGRWNIARNAHNQIISLKITD